MLYAGKYYIYVDLQLEQDDHPSVEELLEIKELFTGRPYSIDRAPKLHMVLILNCCLAVRPHPTLRHRTTI